MGVNYNCNCNSIAIDINVIDPCLAYNSYSRQSASPVDWTQSRNRMRKATRIDLVFNPVDIEKIKCRPNFSLVKIHCRIIAG